MTETSNEANDPKSEAELQFDAAPILRMVCIGKAIDETEKPCWVLLTLDQSNQIISLARFLMPIKNLKDFWVGDIIEIKMEGSTYWPDSAKSVGVWKDTAQRLEWQAEARAWETARRVERETESERRRILLKEHLEPLRRIYRKLPTLQAVSLLAEVIYYLECGTTKTTI